MFQMLLQYLMKAQSQLWSPIFLKKQVLLLSLRYSVNGKFYLIPKLSIQLQII